MINFQKALADPQGVCKNPKNVVKDTTLTKEQKLKILEQWQYDAKLLQVAEEENMPAKTEDTSTMLSRISRAITAVNNQ